MVVLETGSPMVTIGNTQYLQPDYLSSLPTTVREIEKKNFFFLKKFNLMFFCMKVDRKIFNCKISQYF